jgi:hypothetical protein
MASRKQDLLGQLIDTALVTEPDEFPVDAYGDTGLMTPANQDIADDTEDDDAFESLRDDLSPGEAQEVVDTMRPLSPAEQEILENNPGLKGLTRVDNAEHEDWMIENAKRGNKGMDAILDDAVYGDSLNKNEECMERLGLDSDSGFGFHIPGLSSVANLAKGAYKYGKKGVTTPFSLAARAVKKFVPSRDGNKAAMVKNLYKKLWTEHANFLAVQSTNAGRPAQPAQFFDVSKAWAIQQIKQGGLPTQFAVSGADVLGSDILGADVMGSWWNPLSWFSTQTTVVLNNTGDQRSAVGPDGQPLGPDGQPLPLGPDGQPLPLGPDGQPISSDPSMANPAADPQASTDPSAYPPPGGYDPNQDPRVADPSASQGASHMTTGISGEDSLGAFATEILGGVAKTSPNQTNGSATLNLLLFKLRNGRALSPTDIANLATLSQSGDPRARKMYAMLLSKGSAVAGDNIGGSADDARFINLLLFKLRNGKTLAPAEIARLASLSKQGDPRARKMYGILLKGGSSVTGDDSGAWAYMLNPANWFKSSEERQLISTETDKWKENAKLQKDLAKRQQVLDQAQRAKAAAEAVDQAKAQAASTEAQLKEIESSLKGEFLKGLRPKDLNADVNGEFIGHEKPTAVTKVVLDALDKIGKRERAGALYAKIAKGNPLAPDELKDARQISRLLAKVKVVHGDLMDEGDDPALVMHGAFVGACLLGNIGTARAHNAKIGKAAEHLSKILASGKKLTPSEEKAAAIVIADTDKLHDFTKSHVTGDAFAGMKNATKLRGAAFVGAAKVMTDTEKKQLAQIVALAKAGNPRAAKALAALKQSGEIMGGSPTLGSQTLGSQTLVGFGISDAFSFAMKPITYPIQKAWDATKWTARKLGITHSNPSPEDVRLSQLRAAHQRAVAAQARARAADAQTEAELRAQQSIADAAQAEADAADAEALSKEAAMRTKEIEANPDLANQDDGDSSGSFVGAWTKYVGYDPAVKDPFETSAQKKATAKAINEKRLVAKAAEKSATGTKIRAGAALYQRATVSRDPKAMAAIDTMVAKAKKGDPQARRDVLAVKAGAKALKAKDKAIAREIAVANAKTRKLKVIAAQKRVEAAIANKLVRTERRAQLAKYSRVEAMSARGDKKAQTYVAKNVAAAKKGDEKAANRVAAMKLGKAVRLATPTKQDRRGLAQAMSLHARAKKNDPKALRNIAVIDAAAKQGNPNAKRAKKKLELAAALTATVTTGVITVTALGKGKQKSQEKQATLAKAETKLAAGAGTREEYAAGARAASDLGDKETAGRLSVAAANAPSATEQLQKTQSVVAAKKAGNEEAKAAIDKSFNGAKSGDPAEIQKTGKVVAVQTIDDINAGRPIPPAMTDAINLHERVAAGDPVATEQAKTIMAAATQPNPIPEATAAAVTLAAAGITAQALAAKPQARAEFLAKVNPPIPDAEKGTAEAQVNELVAKAKDGTITAAEGDQGIRLAMRLGKPKIAAQISSMAPPMERDNPLSSLPDMPLPPIAGIWDLLKESLKAAVLATRDPIGNYREGVKTRSRVQSEPVGSQTLSSSGWSPFAYFREVGTALKSSVPWIAPLTSSAAAAASIATLAMSKQKQNAPAAPAPAAPAPAAPAPAAPTPAAPASVVEPAVAKAAPKQEETPPASSEGDDPLRKAAAQGQKAMQDRNETAHDQGRLVDLIQKINSGSLTTAEQSEGLHLATKLGLPIAQEKFLNFKGSSTRPTSASGSFESDSSNASEAASQKLSALDDQKELVDLLSKASSKTLTRKDQHRGLELSIRLGLPLAQKKFIDYAAPTKSGEDKKTFKDYIKDALKSKTMSKDDFNAAMAAHLGDKATPEKKVASGEKILKFLAGKGVKVST